MPAKKICKGFGEFEGKCTNLAGHSKVKRLQESFIWCERCDTLRCSYIDSLFRGKLKMTVPKVHRKKRLQGFTEQEKND